MHKNNGNHSELKTLDELQKESTNALTAAGKVIALIGVMIFCVWCVA